MINEWLKHLIESRSDYCKIVEPKIENPYHFFISFVEGSLVCKKCGIVKKIENNENPCRG